MIVNQNIVNGTIVFVFFADSDYIIVNFAIENAFVNTQSRFLCLNIVQ